MLLRYRTSGVAFVPQYSQNGEWKDFTKASVTPNSQFKDLVKMLGNIGHNGQRIWGDAPWYDKNEVVYFKTELLCNAFLGAAQIWFGERHELFEIKDTPSPNQ